MTRRTIEISGKLHADTPSALTTKIEALQSAYSRGGFNAILTEDDGTRTAHKLINSESRLFGQNHRLPIMSDRIEDF